MEEDECHTKKEAVIKVLRTQSFYTHTRLCVCVYIYVCIYINIYVCLSLCGSDPLLNVCVNVWGVWSLKEHKSLYVDIWWLCIDFIHVCQGFDKLKQEPASAPQECAKDCSKTHGSSTNFPHSSFYQRLRSLADVLWCALPEQTPLPPPLPTVGTVSRGVYMYVDTQPGVH